MCPTFSIFPFLEQIWLWKLKFVTKSREKNNDKWNLQREPISYVK
jgi:hypothetical protein